MIGIQGGGTNKSSAGRPEIAGGGKMIAATFMPAGDFGVASAIMLQRNFRYGIDPIGAITQGDAYTQWSLIAGIQHETRCDQ